MISFLDTEIQRKDMPLIIRMEKKLYVSVYWIKGLL